MILFVIYECCVKLINNCISNSRFDWGMGGGEVVKIINIFLDRMFKDCKLNISLMEKCKN